MQQLWLQNIITLVLPKNRNYYNEMQVFLKRSSMKVRVFNLVAVVLVSLIGCKTTPSIDTDNQSFLLPSMVTISKGGFSMGDVSMAGDSDERPTHKVTIDSFQISKFEVTFEQYLSFTEATQHPIPSDSGWGKGKRPVINVSFKDAKAYTKWLSKVTNQSYSLPSETQWEYAARAGSLTLFSNGNNESSLCGVANIADNSSTQAGRSWKVTNCNDNEINTATVGSYRSNAFGLYDMHGNVWEWTKDCWNDSYKGAPSNSKAWLSGDCSKNVIRGGSFQLEAFNSRSSNREAMDAHFKSNQIGFRVVRNL
jgi:formylglycine-generating enzyme required for sulfatase activity